MASPHSDTRQPALCSSGDPNSSASAAEAGADSGFSRSVAHQLCVGVLVLGGLLRLREYAADRSLWLDELSINHSIVRRSFSGLLKPLSDVQAAPVGWLWLEHGVVRLFGDSEWALRAAPFLFSLGSLVVFYVVVRRWLTGLSAVLACAMFALSPDLIRYSVEVKQYGSDLFFVLLVISLTTRLFDRPSAPLTISWAGVGVIAMWSSNPATIALAASATVLIFLRFRARQSMGALLGCSAVLGASLAVEYFTNLRAVSRVPALKQYWAPWLAPQPFHLTHTLRWLWDTLVHLAANPTGLAVAPLSLVMLLVGMLFFVARRGWIALVVFSTVPLAVIGGLLRVYPLHERLALYLVPLLFIGLAALAETRTPLRHNPAAIVGALVIVAVAFPLGRGLAVITTPIDVTNTRGPFAFVAAHWEPGDTMITGSADQTAYEYYGTRYHLPRLAVFSIARTPACDRPPPPISLQSYRRVWVVVTFHSGIEPANRTALYYGRFTQLVGPDHATYHGTGDAAAAVFDVKAAALVSAFISINGQSRCLILRQ